MARMIGLRMRYRLVVAVVDDVVDAGAAGEQAAMTDAVEAAGQHPRLRASGDQESIGRDAQRGVMVEATPSPPFEMAEPDLLLELLANSRHGYRSRGQQRG